MLKSIRSIHPGISEHEFPGVQTGLLELGRRGFTKEEEGRGGCPERGNFTGDGIFFISPALGGGRGGGSNQTWYPFARVQVNHTKIIRSPLLQRSRTKNVRIVM